MTSLDPTYWGKHLWISMFSIAFTYPHNPTTYEQISLINFYNSFCFLLPCPNCKNHYASLLKLYPIKNYSQNNKRVLIWLEIISNKINEKLNKPPVNFNNFYNER